MKAILQTINNINTRLTYTTASVCVLALFHSWLVGKRRRNKYADGNELGNMELVIERDSRRWTESVTAGLKAEMLNLLNNGHDWSTPGDIPASEINTADCKRLVKISFGGQTGENHAKHWLVIHSWEKDDARRVAAALSLVLLLLFYLLTLFLLMLRPVFFFPLAVGTIMGKIQELSSLKRNSGSLQRPRDLR